MPLRLTANDRSLSGHRYDDVLGVRYEFPSRYRRLIIQGERFVYYRGRRRADGSSGPQAYLGAGIIGAVRQGTSNPGHWVCDIAEWKQFTEPLYFRDVDGDYYEPGAVQGGLYWREGVKWLPADVFGRILHAASIQQASRGGTSALPDPSELTAPAGYASAATILAVDMYAVTTATLLLERLWPGSPVEVQPHNNPGFDILVGVAEAPERYIEVKGTLLPFPRFFMSEGERAFATANADRYTLLAIYCIDLERETHRVYRWDGAVTENDFALTPRQWDCEPRGLLSAQTTRQTLAGQ